MIIHDAVDGCTVKASGRPDSYIWSDATWARTILYAPSGVRRTTRGALCRQHGRPLGWSALVHGYSASVDMADISDAYHLLAAGLRTAAYFYYVPSAAIILRTYRRGASLPYPAHWAPTSLKCACLPTRCSPARWRRGSMKVGNTASTTRPT